MAISPHIKASPAEVRAWAFGESYEAHLAVAAMADLDRLMASRRPS